MKCDPNSCDFILERLAIRECKITREIIIEDVTHVCHKCIVRINLQKSGKQIVEELKNGGY